MGIFLPTMWAVVKLGVQRSPAIKAKCIFMPDSHRLKKVKRNDITKNSAYSKYTRNPSGYHAKD
jgi:hypothetical protein